MSIAVIIAIVLLIVIIACYFYVAPAQYGGATRFIGSIAGLILFLIAIGVIHA